MSNDDIPAPILALICSLIALVLVTAPTWGEWIDKVCQ